MSVATAIDLAALAALAFDASPQMSSHATVCRQACKNGSTANGVAICMQRQVTVTMMLVMPCFDGECTVYCASVAAAKI